ncbi:MAG: hypothetical protein IKY18_03670 [Oscillospiraceae bacterium]|nr:hypothetical protein [Oscillospiraceae bacterium]
MSQEQEQMTMFPSPETRAPSNARFYHVKLSSNYQTVEFDVDLMNPNAPKIIDSGVSLVNQLGRDVVNADTARKEAAAARRDMDDAQYSKQATEPATRPQIELLVRHLGGKASTYAKWSKKQAWDKINELKTMGVLNR